MPGQHFPALLEQVPPALFKCGYSLILELSEKKEHIFLKCKGILRKVQDQKGIQGRQQQPG